MEDKFIIELYWARDSAAIPATRDKYGPYCGAVASGILQDTRDREECLSDTWLAAWNSMPPRRPSRLSAYLARITRNLAFNRWQAAQAEKRGGGELTLALEELGDCVSGGTGPEEELQYKELTEALGRFLADLPKNRRTVFLRRYWLVQPVGLIARELGMLPGAVSMSLTRTRRELKTYLQERGFEP